MKKDWIVSQGKNVHSVHHCTGGSSKVRQEKEFKMHIDWKERSKSVFIYEQHDLYM